MILEIDDNKRTTDLQDQFNKSFPYLRIEFYPHVHKKQSPVNIIAGDELIGNIRKKHESGTLEIKSIFTIQKLIKDLKQLFGLYIRVYRLHNDQWMPVNEENVTLQELSNLAEVSIQKSSDIINAVGED